MELTHASFFSGVGGLDLGLERAGWRTVSFSEIDPYANAVLAERWPGVPNLGDIVRLSEQWYSTGKRSNGQSAEPRRMVGDARQDLTIAARRATLWSGGFPCQDLSVAGKRAGFGLQQHGRESESGLRAVESLAAGGQRAGDSLGTGSIGRGVTSGGTRSGLAFAFLDLVERHRPPAILLENVPGLLSSNKGRDFGALLDRLGQLGYWWAYRILDAQFFGVPQRRRRVFICALHAGAGFGADSAAAVLSVGSRCDGHSQAGVEAGEGVAERPAPGVDIARAVTGTSGKRHDDDTDTIVVGSLKTGPRQGWRIDTEEAADGRLTLGPPPDPGGNGAADGLAGRVDDRLPVGLDSHRYRCCGNGVVSNVSEWVGIRLARAVA